MTSVVDDTCLYLTCVCVCVSSKDMLQVFSLGATSKPSGMMDVGGAVLSHRACCELQLARPVSVPARFSFSSKAQISEGHATRGD